MAGRASLVAAAETSVGKVRDHNEDAHFIDAELGIFLVCDGMGGHAAGEVASAIAVQTVHETWGSESTQSAAERWLTSGTPEARKGLFGAVTEGVVAAHGALLAEAERDRTKGGMGTTLVGAMSVGGDIVFAHCGDSRAYLVRDGIAMQLTEDHTLLARLLAAGVDVDTSAEGARFKSMLTNALGIGQECKVSTFIVPVADGDRFLLCSDGITEYVTEPEIGEVLCKQPSPAKAASKLVELALERGGGDNATALVVRVLEAGETSRPSELLRRESEAIDACPLWVNLTPQQRLRALRIALERDYSPGQRVPALTLGDRVAWIVIEGELEQDGTARPPGSLLYPEALLADRPVPDKDGLAVAVGDIRLLALRSDDFRELCEDDPELGEVLLEALAIEISLRRSGRRTRRLTGDTAPGDRVPTAELEQAPTPPTGLDRADTPPVGIDRTPRLGTRTPPKGIHTAALRAATPLPIAAHVAPAPVRPITPPRGSPAARATPMPAAHETTPGKGSPISPRVPVPRTERPTDPLRPSKLKRASSLFVADRVAAESAIDRALSNLTLDAVPELTEEREPTPAPVITGPPEEEQVIAFEAEPADLPPPRPAQPPSRGIGQSEPEISIVALEMDADEPPEPTVEMEADEPPPPEPPKDDPSEPEISVVAPRDEPSEPEIVVVKPGRAVTADDAPHTAGTIDRERDRDK